MKYGLLKTIILGKLLIDNLIFVLAYSCCDRYVCTNRPFFCIISAFAYIFVCKKITLAIYDMDRMSNYYMKFYLAVFLNDIPNWKAYNANNSMVTWPCGDGGCVVGLTRWLPVVLMSRVITSYLFARFGELKINSAENWPHLVLINYDSAKPASCVFD